ncbi:MAG: tripartite tricarboxylate transporter substrate binding protein [Pigmentiphaga sp.]
MKKLVLLALSSAVLHGTAFAQAPAFPNKPVRIVSTFSTGAGPDVFLRLVADQLSKRWGQPVIVENKSGGSGFIAASDARRAAADGYTLFHADGVNFTAIPHLYKRMPYDAEKDFVPVSPIHHSYFFVAVSAQSKWNSINDLLAEAKAKPGTVTFGSWQIGSVAHLGGELLNEQADVRMTHVPFKDNSQLYTSVANGEVGWAYGSSGSAGPLQKAGKLKFLALAGPERLDNYRSVPTVSEAGGPKDFQVSGWVGFFAPQGTPKNIVDQINKATQEVLKNPDIAAKMVEFGYMPLLLSPEDIQAQIKRESTSYGQIIKNINLTLD